MLIKNASFPIGLSFLFQYSIPAGKKVFHFSNNSQEAKAGPQRSSLRLD
jgi:hypothetical protein